MVAMAVDGFWGRDVGLAGTSPDSVPHRGVTAGVASGQRVPEGVEAVGALVGLPGGGR